MFSSEAMRLAAVEVLAPTSALVAGTGFPTLAGRTVYDSRAITVGELNGDAPYTPALSLYSGAARATQRGDATDAEDYECEAVLDIVGELATRISEEGEELADAMAGDDPEARLVLAALMAQARFMLMESEAGELFRRQIVAVRRIDEEPYAMPELGLRWQRTTLRLTCTVRQDRFDAVNGGLPRPIRDLLVALPAESYARSKLQQLAAHFAGRPRTPLAGIDFADPALGAGIVADTE